MTNSQTEPPQPPPQGYQQPPPPQQWDQGQQYQQPPGGQYYPPQQPSPVQAFMPKTFDHKMLLAGFGAMGLGGMFYRLSRSGIIEMNKNVLGLHDTSISLGALGIIFFYLGALLALFISLGSLAKAGAGEGGMKASNLLPWTLIIAAIVVGIAFF